MRCGECGWEGVDSRGDENHHVTCTRARRSPDEKRRHFPNLVGDTRVCDRCRVAWPCPYVVEERKNSRGGLRHLASLFLGAAGGVRNVERVRANRRGQLTPDETALAFEQGFDEEQKRHDLPTLRELEVLRVDGDD